VCDACMRILSTQSIFFRLTGDGILHIVLQLVKQRLRKLVPAHLLGRSLTWPDYSFM
jgi:hypothetical protein